MMNIISVCVISVVAFIFSLTIRSSHPSISLRIIITTSVLIMIYLLDYLTEVITYVQELFSKVNISTEYIKILLKCTGICFITEFTCDLCRDSGYSSLSSQISLAGKMIALVMAVPMFKEVLSISLSLAGVS